MENTQNIVPVGYDYGSTTSLLESFNKDSQLFCELARCCSEWTQGCQYIPSPKRLLSQSNIETTDAGEPLASVELHIPVSDVISDFTNSLIQNNCQELKGHRIRLTLTVPDSYTNFECSLMLKSICRAFKNYFGDQFDSTQDVVILPEPVAAALYYTYINLNEFTNGYKDLLICDIGGGTTDLAIVRVKVKTDEFQTQTQSRRYNLSFNVLATAGNPQLGGNDITKVLVKRMSLLHSIEPYSSNSKWFWDNCEKLKIELSYTNNDEDPAVIYVEDNNGNPFQIDGQDLYISCNRKELEAWIIEEYQENNGLGNKLRDCINEVKRVAKGKIKELNSISETHDIPGINFNTITIVPVGGSMRMPLFRKTLEKEMGARASMADIHDDGIFDCVSRGAALYSAHETGQLSLINRLNLENRTPYSISVGHGENNVKECIPRNAVAGVYDVTLYPLNVDCERKTFVLSEFNFYQSAHEARDIKDVKFFGTLKLDHETEFEVSDCSPEKKELRLRFEIDKNIRRVGVRLEIKNVRLLGSDNFELLFKYPKVGFYYFNF
jgi:hypothetical protein